MFAGTVSPTEAVSDSAGVSCGRSMLLNASSYCQLPLQKFARLGKCHGDYSIYHCHRTTHKANVRDHLKKVDSVIDAVRASGVQCTLSLAVQHVQPMHWTPTWHNHAPSPPPPASLAWSQAHYHLQVLQSRRLMLVQCARTLTTSTSFKCSCGAPTIPFTFDSESCSHARLWPEVIHFLLVTSILQ
jgi:hypothetical protein